MLRFSIASRINPPHLSLKFFVVCEELCIILIATCRAFYETPLALSFFLKT